MKRFVGSIAALVVALGLGAAPAHAQYRAQHWWVYPAMGTGVLVKANGGFGLNEDSQSPLSSGKPISYGGEVVLGFAVGQVSVGVSGTNPKQDEADSPALDNGFTWGGTLAINLYQPEQSALVVNAFGGVGFNRDKLAEGGTGAASTSATSTNVRGGLGVGVRIPAQGVHAVIYAAPGLHVVNLKVPGVGLEGNNYKAGFGVSGGANVTLPVGLFVAAGIDFTTISVDDGSSTSGSTTSFSPVVVGVSLGWHFQVPSFGVSHGLIGS